MTKKERRANVNSFDENRRTYEVMMNDKSLRSVPEKGLEAAYICPGCSEWYNSPDYHKTAPHRKKCSRLSRKLAM